MKRMWIQMWTVGAVVMIAMLAFIAVAQASGCVDDDGEPGIFHPVDGCITADVYNEMFSAESLSGVPSLVDPGRSVADVYQVPAQPDAADRPRMFMGVELLTFREIVGLWAT